MDKIIELWSKFIKEWREDSRNKQYDNLSQVNTYIKPTFFDFMEWLRINN